MTHSHSLNLTAEGAHWAMFFCGEGVQGGSERNIPPDKNLFLLQPEEFLVSKFQALRERGLLTIFENFYEKHHCFKNYSW